MRNDIAMPAAVIAVFLTATTLSAPTFAASCIAGKAAEAGSDGAYERAKEEIKTIEDAEENANSEWGKCLGSISGQVAWPTFPSAAGIFDKIKEEICRIARDKVDDQLDQVNNGIDDIYNQIPSEVEVPVIGNVGGDTGSVSVGSSQGSLSNFYEGIWQ